MAGGHSDREVQAHITRVAGRSHSDIQILADALQDRSWPDGGDDRTKPAALPWLRRWRPGGPRPRLPFCECATGRCLVCN
jgi:hypothetical protein